MRFKVTTTVSAARRDHVKWIVPQVTSADSVDCLIEQEETEETELFSPLSPFAPVKFGSNICSGKNQPADAVGDFYFVEID